METFKKLPLNVRVFLVIFGGGLVFIFMWPLLQFLVGLVVAATVIGVLGAIVLYGIRFIVSLISGK